MYTIYISVNNPDASATSKIRMFLDRIRIVKRTGRNSVTLDTILTQFIAVLLLGTFLAAILSSIIHSCCNDSLV
jgi:hypothetical protein